MYSPAVETGLDRLSSQPALLARLRESRVGLVAHPASVTRDLVHAVDLLAALSIVPEVLFGPEHGWAGHAQDMIGVGDVTDAARGTRIVSLYGESFSDLSPKASDLDGLDVVVIDMQDVGARYYTFVWTAVLVARACREKGIRVLVLDRPNPIGGTAIEGKLQSAGFSPSSVSSASRSATASPSARSSRGAPRARATRSSSTCSASRVSSARRMRRRGIATS